jgi:Leishmanolysin
MKFISPFALLILLTLTACPSSSNTVPPDAPGYNVTVLFDSSVQDKYKQSFRDAAARWEKIITGDLPNVTNVSTSSNCSEVSVPGTVTVDDVAILVGTFSDGAGGLLGFAGPCGVRKSNALTILGEMKFDTKDMDSLLADGQLNATITHEMGHVLGLGTLWDNLNLVKYAGDADKNGCDDNPRYTGAKGIAEYKKLLGADADVPVENGFGSGSCEGHWRESVFKKELMTSFLNSGTNPLSRLSIASMEDLGYTVSYSSAELFTLSLPDLLPQAQPLKTTQTILIRPTSVIDDRP